MKFRHNSDATGVCISQAVAGWRWVCIGLMAPAMAMEFKPQPQLLPGVMGTFPLKGIRRTNDDVVAARLQY